MAPVATEFDKIINLARERKKNEALADKIFSANRRQTLPSNLRAAPGGSLASRVGVKKPPPRPQQNTKFAQRHRPGAASSHANGWNHDLYRPGHVNGGSRNSLKSRVSIPGAPTGPAHNTARVPPQKKTVRVQRPDTDPSPQDQANVVKPPSTGISIRGLAGPFAVLAQNFAPGTTAADIESAMTPIGGEMVSCRIIKTQPIILAEMAFTSREGGERVIETFNNKTADGRIIQVFAKPGGYQPDQNTATPRSTTTTTREHIIDGKNGFPEDMATADHFGSALYSDSLLDSKRVRGFQQGRGGWH